MNSLASHVRSALQSAPEVGPLERLRRGSVLLDSGPSTGGLFLIESGLVKMTRTSDDGRSLILSVMGPHQIAGVESLAQAELAHRTNLICLTDVTGYRIPLSTAKRLLSSLPELAAGIVNYLLLQDQERISRIEMLTLYDVEHRILHALAELAQLVKPNADGASYSIPITQVELASLVGATRETTSSTLSLLQTRNLVTLGRRLVTAVEPKMLMDAANSRLAQTQATP